MPPAEASYCVGMNTPDETPNGEEALPATPEQTREILLTRSGRCFAPIPKVFIQKPGRASAERAGLLANFVRRGDKRGLVAFLLLQSIISSGDHEHGWSTTLPLKVWARAMNTVATASGASATSAATKILSRLEQRGLVQRQRSGRGRQVRVTLLAADGSGAPYVRPTGKTQEDRFLKLSHRLWTDGWDERLSLPALAMLLIVLHEKPWAALPTEKMPEWYGVSADTAQRGLKELEEWGLVWVDQRSVTAPLSPTGLAIRNHYNVRAPFDESSLAAATKALNAQRKGRVSP